MMAVASAVMVRIGIIGVAGHLVDVALAMRRRVRGRPVAAFGEERRRRGWLAAAASHADRWPAAVGLLALRHDIDAELSGHRLAALADAAGEALFDGACDAPVPDFVRRSVDQPLTPEAMLAAGRSTIAFATANPRSDEAALLDLAVAILRGTA